MDWHLWNCEPSCFLFLSGIVSETRKVTQLGLRVEVKPSQHLARQFHGWIKYLVYYSCPHLWGSQAFGKSLFSVSFASCSIEKSSERTWWWQLHPRCVRVKNRSFIPNSPVSLLCPRRHGLRVLTCSMSWDSWGWPLLLGAIGLSNSPMGTSTAVGTLPGKPEKRVWMLMVRCPCAQTFLRSQPRRFRGTTSRKPTVHVTQPSGRGSQLFSSLWV